MVITIHTGNKDVKWVDLPQESVFVATVMQSGSLFLNLIR
jgi:hypothetical protein